MTYKVVSSGKAKRSVQRLTPTDKERLKERILQIIEAPRSAGKPLMGAFKEKLDGPGGIRTLDQQIMSLSL